MNRYRIVHVTEFHYDGPVSESYNQVWLRPLQDETQSCLSFRLSTDPNSFSSSHIDSLGNWVHRFNVIAEHRRLRIEADSTVLVQDPPAMPSSTCRLDKLEEFAETLEEYYDLLAPTDFVPHAPEVIDLVKLAEQAGDGSAGGFAKAAANLIFKTFRYEKGATHVHSSIQDSLETRSGVCQDFAHLLSAVLRMGGLPARYVSGYLAPPRTGEFANAKEEVIGGMASHAWAEVFLPGCGWFGLDPTLGREVDMQHVRLAYGRDYGDVAPVRGVYKGKAGQRLSVDVRVRPGLDDESFGPPQEGGAAVRTVSAQGDLPHQQQQQQQ